MAKFEIKRTSDFEYRFNLKAANGKVILASETYNTADGAKKSIESLKRHGIEDSWYDRMQTREGKWYFTMKSTNGKIIGTSQKYRSRSGMYKGIRAVKKSAGNAEVIELYKIKTKVGASN